MKRLKGYYAFVVVFTLTASAVSAQEAVQAPPGMEGMDPAMAEKILFHVGTWLREADEQIKSMGLYDIYGRIVYGFLKFPHQNQPNGVGQIVIEPKPSIQELADRIGSSRETVSRALKVLKKNNYLRQVNGSYILEQRIIALYPLLTKDLKPSCTVLAS